MKTKDSAGWFARDAFSFADRAVGDALDGLRGRVSALVRKTAEVEAAPPGLSVWARAQRTLQILDRRTCDILHEVGYDGARTRDMVTAKVLHAQGTVS